MRTPVAADAAASRALRRSSGGYFIVAWCALLAALTGAGAAGLPLRSLAQSVAVFGLLTALAWRWLPQHLPQRTFGAANAVTLLRGGGAALLAALINVGAGAGTDAASSWAWPALALALLLLLLDGVDGWLARRNASASAFGARFDMETDALLVVVLAVLVWQTDKAGVWVLLAGAWRYLFVLAGRLWPALAAPLPYSRRRQSVCVIQLGTLLACLCPLLAAPFSSALALTALLLLSASFIYDGAWLWRAALRTAPGSA